MNMSPKFFVFFITILIITVIGIIAGVNLIMMNSTSIPVSSTHTIQIDNQSDRQDQGQAQSQKIVTKGIFLSTTTLSTTTLGKSSQVVNPITAYAYLVGNVDTGQVYFSSNQSEVLPVASMSKLMTAIVATDEFTPTTTIEITSLNMEVATDTSNLYVGEKFTLKEILQPLLLSSSNIAAEAIASTAIDRAVFMNAMSNTAWEIGMPHAYFADPSGLDPENHANAKDVFAMAEYLYKYRPDILEITRTIQANLATTTNHGSHIVNSTHPFVTDPRFIGGKTGRTFEAGETMLTILNIDNKPIVFIVLHSKYGYRATDTSQLIKKFISDYITA